MDKQDKWGIIFCPRSGQRRPGKLWRKIEKCLQNEGISYDHVQSETSGSVDRLVKMMINNGYRTIIIAGGDSALNDAVNSLMQVESDVRNEIALGVIPNGLNNDFVHFWEISDKDIEKTIQTLKQRRIKRLDLGYILYNNAEGQRCRRYFNNSLTIGLVTSVINLRRHAKLMGGLKMVSYFFSSLRIIAQRLEYKMHLHINTDEISGKVMTVCIGNATGYGFTPNAVPYNGFLDVSVVHHPKMTQLAEGLYLLFSGKILNHRDVMPFRTQKVTVKTCGKAPIGIDGRLMKQPKGEFTVGIEKEVINFIIP